jgi:biotin transport system substrate-specific component
VLAFALATALAAQIRIPLPSTPVPITLQTAAVLLAGVTLGARLGTISMALYVGLGVVGYSVFATGRLGLESLAGPTAGYLLGFVAAQWVLGALTRPGQGGALRTLSALLAGHAVVFAFGLAWLSVWGGYGPHETIEKGLAPFLAGTVIKTLASWPLALLALRGLRGGLDPQVRSTAH